MEKYLCVERRAGQRNLLFTNYPRLVPVPAVNYHVSERNARFYYSQDGAECLCGIFSIVDPCTSMDTFENGVSCIDVNGISGGE